MIGSYIDTALNLLMYYIDNSYLANKCIAFTHHQMHLIHDQSLHQNELPPIGQSLKIDL